jgi:hypothetical protein
MPEQCPYDDAMDQLSDAMNNAWNDPEALEDALNTIYDNAYDELDNGGFSLQRSSDIGSTLAALIQNAQDFAAALYQSAALAFVSIGLSESAATAAAEADAVTTSELTFGEKFGHLSKTDLIEASTNVAQDSVALGKAAAATGLALAFVGYAVKVWEADDRPSTAVKVGITAHGEDVAAEPRPRGDERHHDTRRQRD